MNVGSGEESRGTAINSGSRPGIKLAWLSLIFFSFVAGLGVATLGLSSMTFDPVAEQGVSVTPTAIPPTRIPQPTPSLEARSPLSSLATLYLTIAADDFAKVAEKRAEALRSWILQADSSDFVNVTVQLEQDQPVSARLRLKGDWGDHFAGDKWSYRIQTRGGAGVLGMRVFSLQDPSTRAYLNEWLFMAHLREEGILSVRYDFVHGVQNGEPVGIYAVEEGFAKELLESQGRRESVIIRYDEDLLWDFWSRNENDLSTPLGVNRFYIIDEFSSGSVNADPLLSAQRDVAVGKARAWWMGELSFGKVFNVDLMARFWALTDLWGAQHGLQWHNLRYYYNPVTTLLEPIGFDAHPLAMDSLVDSATLPGRSAAMASGDAEVYRRYTHYLWAFSQPDYLEDFRIAYIEEFERLQAALWSEFGSQLAPDGESVLAAPWDKLAYRQLALREMLTPFQMTYVYRPTHSPTSTLWLDVGNLTGSPVEIVGIQIGDRVLPASPEWVAPASSSEIVIPTGAQNALILKPLSADAAYMPYVRLEIGVHDLSETAVDVAADAIELVTRFWGLNQTVTQPVLSAYPLPTDGPMPASPTLEQALSRYPLLVLSDSDPYMLQIRPGTWSITIPMVLPQGYGLSLGPGTTLRFAAESYLLARGPLVFRGTETAPVHLGPIDKEWYGIVVLESDRPSSWDFVTVSDTQAIEFPGWTLTGAITFYESPVSLNHVTIRGTSAEDAINVIRSEFVFRDSHFADTYSDAFDADFSRGEVLDCSFTDIGGDAIDISGSQVSVHQVRIVGTGDKAVSVGEASQFEAVWLSIEDADFGVVSKDLSHVSVDNSTMSGIRVAALAAYIKKPTYGPAMITANNVVFEDVNEDKHTLVQTGCWIDLEGERIWGVDLDVDALYLD